MSCGRNFDKDGKNEHGQYPIWMARPFSGLSGWWEILNEHGWAVALVPYDVHGGRHTEEQNAERIVSAMNASYRTRLSNFHSTEYRTTQHWPKKGDIVSGGGGYDVDYVVQKVEWDGSLIVKYMKGQAIDPADMKDKFGITIDEWRLPDESGVWYPVHSEEVFNIAHRIERRS